MYSKEDRNKVQNALIEFARTDDRITDCAVVGSESVGENDKWSDIDLTFGFDNRSNIEEILLKWNQLMKDNFNANVLFDLTYRESIYRVYLLPNALQVDLSFTPDKYFGAITERFKLIFGKQNKREFKSVPEIKTVLGYTVLFALKARTSLERKRYWQAQYYLSKFRENIMTFKCLLENMNPFDGREFDELPPGFLNRMQSSFFDEPNEQNLSMGLNILTRILIDQLQQTQKLDYKFIEELKLIGR